MNIKKLFAYSEDISSLFETIFKTSLVFYFILLLGGEIFSGFVSNYFSLNLVIIIMVSSGLLSIILNEKKQFNELMALNYPLIIFLGIIGIALVYIKTSHLGSLAYLLSLLAGGLIAAILTYLKKLK